MDILLRLKRAATYLAAEGKDNTEYNRALVELIAEVTENTEGLPSEEHAASISKELGISY